MITLSTPNLIGNEKKYLNKCIDGNWVSTAGEYINLFEKKISKFTGSKYTIACINATAALDISLKLLKVEEGDEVIAPTLTFISPINAILYNKASPIFMDCDEFYNIDISKTLEFIKTQTFFKNGYTYNNKTKQKIKAIIIVHVWGNAVWLDELYKICKHKNIEILEDASESLGTIYTKGKFKSKHTGTIGKIGCISFNGNKIITSGGGGAIITNDRVIADKALYLTTQAKDDPIKYIHDEVGYNLRLTNINAAVGLAQIEKIKKILKLKRNIYNNYKKEIYKIKGYEFAKTPEYASNNHWLNILRVNSLSKDKTNLDLLKFFSSNKVQTRPVWYLNHLQKKLKKYQVYKIKRANLMVKNSLCIPSSSHLTNKQFNTIIKLLKKFLHNDV